ncbi:MAG: hypothetical protein V4726_16260 [Verrucomicrobiota bacterium]
MNFRLLLLLPVLLFSACGKTEQAVPRHTELETPAGEAVLRQVLSLCPHRAAAKQLTIVLGEKMDAATKPFEQKFNDTGLLVTPARKLEAGMANGQVRIYDSVTQEPPVILQLSSLTADPGDAAGFEAIAAWSWKTEAKRHRYTVRPKSDGTFDVKQGEEIPIATRNQDGIRDVK